MSAALDAVWPAVLSQIWQGMLAASWVEQVATVLGLWAVWLSTRQKLLNFPIGMIYVVLTASVFVRHKLFADAFLQAVYFIALAYGWWSWSHPGHARKRLPVTLLKPWQLLALIALGLTVTFFWSRLLAQWGDPMPVRDAFLASFGIICQWLEARKKLESWVGWVILNIVALGVYGRLGLYWFVVLFSLYFVLAVVGLRAWWVSYQQDKIHEVTA